MSETPAPPSFAPYLGVLLTVAAGIWAAATAWGAMDARVQEKADKAAVVEVERRLDAHLQRSDEYWRINRTLLCRHPEIRPDSYCEGYR